MWLLLLALWTGAPASAGVVDRVVVVVGEEPILSSDLAADAWLQRYDHSRFPFWADPPADPLGRLIDAATIRMLAGEVALYQPSDEDLRRRLETLALQHFATAEAMEADALASGVDPTALRAMLRRRLLVERYFNRNLLARPEESAAWWASASELLAAERERTRVRRVDLAPPP